MSVYETVLESYSTEKEVNVGMYFASSTMRLVNNVTVRLRPGWNQYDGEYAVNRAGVDTFSTGAYGNLYVNLPYGVYTMEITWGGEPYGYSNVYLGSGFYAYHLD